MAFIWGTEPSAEEASKIRRTEDDIYEYAVRVHLYKQQLETSSGGSVNTNIIPNDNQYVDNDYAEDYFQ
jgi:hypothetical protein